MKDVKLANSIKDIGEVAFCGCNSLTYIDIPDGIEKIGKQAFIRCNNLKKIKLPDSIKIIGERAFAYCGNLSEINIPEGIIEIASGICDGCDLKSIDMPDSVQEIGSWAFSSNKLTEIVIPDSVQEIGSYAFYRNNFLKVTIPNGVQKIATGMFGDCEDLVEVELPDSITSIGAYAFERCHNLKYIKIPAGITSIEANTFRECESLEYISLPNGITSIKESVFEYCKQLKSIKLPDTITSIGAYAFYGCNQLTLSLSNNITDIGYRALDGCKVSDRVWVEDAWYSTDMSVLYEVSENREEFHVPETVTTIESYAFSQLRYLTKVILPESVKTIRQNAFDSCQNVTDLVIPASVTSIGHNALEGCGNYSISEENPNYTVLDGILYNKDMTELLDCPDDKEGTVVIPSTVTRIGESAFSMCYKLTNIEIPDTVTTIGAYAFQYCSSQIEMVLPNQVTEIGKYAFQNIHIKDGIIPSSLKIIEEYAFADTSMGGSIEIPETIEEIGDYAFYNAGGHTVTIPATVTCIGEKAFGYHDNWTRTGMEKNDIIIKGELGTEAERYAQINDFTFTIHNSDLVVSGKCGENVFYEIRGTEKDGYNLTISGFGDMYDDYENEIKPYNPKGSRPGWDGFQIKDVKILDGVTSIGDYAFIQLDADRMIIPLSVKKIGSGAFARCRIDKIYFLGDAPEIVSRDYWEEEIFLFAGGPFYGGTVYYPIDNNTWTDEAIASYGGYYTWIPEDLAGIQLPVVAQVAMTSYGDVNDSVTIALLDGDTELDRIQTTEDSYTFTFLSQGTYTLRASKANHVTRDYEITLGSEDIALDINICPVGDATGDGKVNTRDLNRLYAHVNGTNPLNGYEFACGDVVGTDSTINTRDLNRLYAHISESNLLW